MTTLKYDPSAGYHISHACSQACKMAKYNDSRVEFDFNGIPLVALPDSMAADLAASYEAECNKRHTEWLASPERKAQQEEAARKTAEKEAQCQTLLSADKPEMTLADPETWEKAKANNSDPYGAGVIEFACTWARLMEARISQGATVTECAEECSRLADNGITGFMYGCAVGILAKVWIHGEELRRWHNKETQLGDEGDRANETGGVLNPALLNIG